MNILIATDTFKDAATASQIGQWLEKGILQTLPTAVCTHRPLADGGEGTLDAVAPVLGGIWKRVMATDSLGRPLEARYLHLPHKAAAIVEMSQASGLEQLKQNERNCLKTTTFGTGQVVLDALRQGVKEIVLTVGGTATNDAGMGLATALGFSFLDESGHVLLPIGENMERVSRIETANVSDQVLAVEWTIATDVTNLFFGLAGAAHIFAAQKGATLDGILALDAGLKNMADVLHQVTGRNPQAMQGSGAGGGVAGGMACLLNARIISGADWVLDINDMATCLLNSDILITGEGKVDSQTWGGKLVSSLLRLAEQAHVPVIIICGTLTDISLIASQPAVIYATSILQSPMTLETAIAQTQQLTEAQGSLLGKLLSARFGSRYGLM